MPRQTSATYYHAHKYLRHFWLSQVGVFAELSSTDQWLLHDYYQPSQDWSKDQLLTHRADITKRRPGLPQQAGRAYAKFQRAAAAHASQLARAQEAAGALAGGNRRGEHIISVKAVVKPEPDAKKFARALLAIAREEQARKRQDDDAA